MLKQYPFTLTPNTEFYCNLRGYQAALNVILFSLHTGEGIVKVIGEVGSGKTLLCRKILNVLDSQHYVVAYIPTPDYTPTDLRKMIARDLGAKIADTMSDSEITQLLIDRLIYWHRTGKRVVVLIDEGQLLSDDSLEALRLLTNIETESKKLLQIILFAQPELNLRLRHYSFRQLNQRITFSHELTPLNPEDFHEYLSHRLIVSGHEDGQLFDRKAKRLLYRMSGGIPRVVNILGHKAMLAAYGLGQPMVGWKAMRQAIRDSKEITRITHKRASLTLELFLWIALSIIIVMGVGIFHYYFETFLR